MFMQKEEGDIKTYYLLESVKIKDINEKDYDTFE